MGRRTCRTGAFRKADLPCPPTYLSKYRTLGKRKYGVLKDNGLSLLDLLISFLPRRDEIGP